jgi:hypothetical protein
MGCDYYIYPYLKITHKHGIDYYALDMKRGYYTYFYEDGDDEDDKFLEEENERQIELNKLYETYQKIILKSTKPKTLFQNEKWIHEEYKNKYETYVKSYLDGKDSPFGGYSHFKNEGEKLKDWNDILFIHKVEYRRNWDNE